MNNIINKVLLTGNKFIPELHLKQLGFTCVTCRPFNKPCKIIQKFKETVNLKHLFRSDLEKSCFVHDATYSVFG